MPTYDYKCTACGHTFEKFESIKSEPMKRCPQCGKAKVKRLIGTGAGLIFKGSGFYITDYRDAGYKKDKAKADSGGGTAGAEGGGASKSEGKTEGKAGDGASTPAAPTGGESKAAPSQSDTKSSSSARGEGKSSKKKR